MGWRHQEPSDHRKKNVLNVCPFPIPVPLSLFTNLLGSRAWNTKPTAKFLTKFGGSWPTHCSRHHCRLLSFSFMSILLSMVLYVPSLSLPDQQAKPRNDSETNCFIRSFTKKEITFYCSFIDVARKLIDRFEQTNNPKIRKRINCNNCIESPVFSFISTRNVSASPYS